MSSSKNILSFIAGIDNDYRILSPQEVDGLTDWFGQWLARTPVSSRQLSLRSLLNEALTPGCYGIYAVADGLPIVYDHNNEDNPLNSVSRHLRFIIVALPDLPCDEDYDYSRAIHDKTLCIVGSANPDGEEEFLQCASWDPKGLDKGHGIMRFYERKRGQWIYVGSSLNAFNSLSIEKGPFDGHIGGGMIMKELTSPWTHWYDDNNMEDFARSLGSTAEKPSKCDPYNALYDKLFAGDTGVPFMFIQRAEELERVVELSVTKWYASRFVNDFIDKDSGLPRSTVTAVRDWVGHILLSRSMNIAASDTPTSRVQAQNNDVHSIPHTLFFNLNAIKAVLPKAGISSRYNIKHAHYIDAVNHFGLNLYYADYSLDPPDSQLAVKLSEGPYAFPIIEPGYDDYEGVQTLVTNLDTATLLPIGAIAAMLMVDFL